MRRRIKISGRRQLDKSAVRVVLAEVAPGKHAVTLTLADPESFKGFPSTAKLSLRLAENKRIEILEFGPLQKPSSTRELPSGFTAPSCQLRVADTEAAAKGRLLGSTDSWTLRGDPEEERNGKGILQFLAADTAPQSWKLETRDSDYPLVRIDRRIPNAAMWARNDPTFLATALPAVVRQVFDEILRQEYPEDTPWVSDWIRWADTVMFGQAPPIGGERDSCADYLERLLDCFCEKHHFAGRLLKAMASEVQP